MSRTETLVALSLWAFNFYEPSFFAGPKYLSAQVTA